MRRMFTLLLLFVLMFNLNAQNNKTNERKISDAFEELESGSLVLRFFDALSGEPIKGGKVEIESFGLCETDFDGRALFASENENCVLKVKFTHPKYITSEFEIEIMAGTLFFNRFSVSPRMPLGSLRVVLDWSDSPLDLDAHLVKKGEYHISYRKMLVSADGTARLDRDDVDGYGPETITANRVDENSEYLFFIHDYSNLSSSSSESLSESKASIKVYGRDNELLDVFKVPQNKTGTYWHVFRIVQDRIIPVNLISDSE